MFQHDILELLPYLVHSRCCGLPAPYPASFIMHIQLPHLQHSLRQNREVDVGSIKQVTFSAQIRAQQDGYDPLACWNFLFHPLAVQFICPSFLPSISSAKALLQPSRSTALTTHTPPRGPCQKQCWEGRRGAAEVASRPTQPLYKAAVYDTVHGAKNKK